MVLAFGATLMIVQCLLDLAALFSPRFVTGDKPRHSDATLA